MKLPVIAIIVDAYRLLFANFGIAARLNCFPVLLQFAAAIVARNYLPGLDPENPDRFSWLTTCLEAASYLFAIPAETAWYRLVILGKDDSHARIRYSVRLAEWRYLIRGVLLFIIVGAVFTCLATAAWAIPPLSQAMESLNIEELVLAALLGIAIFSVTHLLFVLPSAALGQRADFRDSLRTTRGNGWRLFLLIILAVGPSIIFLYIMDYIFFESIGWHSGVYPIEYLVLEFILYFFFITIDVSAIALSFKTLVPAASLSRSAFTE